MTSRSLVVIEARHGESIGEFSVAHVRDALREAGVVLWRGFAVDLAGFSRLIGKHSSRTTLDPAREFRAENVQHVDSGTAEIGFHRENELSPFPPDLVWFYCQKAASRGSETTVCDGERVWRAMARWMRELFWGKPLQYEREIPERLWKIYVAYQHPTLDNPEQVRPAHLFELLADRRDSAAELLASGAIRFRRSVPAVAPSRLSQRLAFANSILGPSYNYQAPRILLDGRPIPERAIAELRRITTEVHDAIAWRDRDVVMIDNSRVMHGRREILDPDRTICIGMSLA